MTPARGKRWEHFPHGADIGVRGVGSTPAEAFEMAAVALTAVAVDPSRVAPRREVAVACAAPDLDLLLVDWLNAVIYEMDTRGMLFSRFGVSIDGTRLTGRLAGEPVDRARHEPAVDAKGATLTALKVAREDGLWVAQCVVDV